MLLHRVCTLYTYVVVKQSVHVPSGTHSHIQVLLFRFRFNALEKCAPQSKQPHKDARVSGRSKMSTANKTKTSLNSGVVSVSVHYHIFRLVYFMRK